MSEINKFHLCKSELSTLINEVDHLEGMVVDAMIREQNPEQHITLNQYYEALEVKRNNLDQLYFEITLFEGDFNRKSNDDLIKLRGHEQDVDKVMGLLHTLKTEICSFISIEIDQQSMAS